MDVDALVEELRRMHCAHTIILYGSRARGDATAESDIDVAAFADVPETTRDARLWDSMYLDGFVYPTAIASAPVDVDLLKLCGGRALLDERGLAGPLFERLSALEHAGPGVLSDPEQRMRCVWARKMQARIRRGDVEAHYRYHWLLFQLLEDHFAMRGAWYRGPKRALAHLHECEPAVYAAFAAALAPGSSLAALDELVELVVGP